jgi:hypothetical protein
MIRLLHYFLLFLPVAAHTQHIDIDLFGGISNYQGDLQPSFFTVKGNSPGAAIILKYGLNQNFYIRTGFSFGSMSGTDEDKSDDRRPRNLNFRSKLQEFDLGLEYRLIKPSTFPVTPYGFVAFGVFHFNPYTFYGNSNEKIYLQPLSTEGQGLTGYPERPAYKLTQFCIPYGVGVKWQINCNLNVGFEFRHTKTFTDYLDDVSTTYVDQKELLAQRGQLAVDLAWRRDEFDGRPYPVNAGSTDRGNPVQKDWFYFAGFTIGLKLNDCETGMFTLGGLFKTGSGTVGNNKRSGANWGPSGRKGARKKLGCPSF